MNNIIERTNKNGTFTVVGRYKTIQEGLEALKKIKSPLYHAFWPEGWTETEFGYMPYAWKGKTTVKR